MSWRSIWILAFAIAGAWLSALWMPSLLDFIFVSVERANMTSPRSETVDDLMRAERRGEPLRPNSGGTTGSDGSNQGEGTGQSQPGTGGATTGGGTTASGSGASGLDHSGDSPPKGTSEPIAQIAKKAKNDEPVGSTGYTGSSNPSVIAAMALLGAIIGGGIGTILITLWEKSMEGWSKMEIGDKVSLFIGIFAGIVASMPFLFVFQGLGGTVSRLLTFALILGFSTISILALKSMEDVLPWQKNKFSGKRTGRKILDTNVIIDGRILDVARTGFLEGEIYVSKSVIDELQHIADSPDALRRQRGRRGLEILKLLQADYDVSIGTLDDKIDHDGEVDDRLVKLAKALGGDLVSNDFNLNKVATLQSVRVLNINDLALSLRPNVLPGEHLTVGVIREGNQPEQGIGYLDDGTMVVIERGKPNIGDTVEVSVTQVIQTERGKMIFAEKPVKVAGRRAESEE